MLDRAWTGALTRSLLAQACLALGVAAFCVAAASIRPNGASGQQKPAYGFAYTGSGLLIGAQIWSAFSSPPFWLLKARAYERAGEIDQAAQALLTAVNLSGFDPTIALNYAQFLVSHDHGRDAEQFLIAEHNRRPDSLTVLARLAQVELALRQWDKAETVAEAIRKLDTGGNTADQIEAASLMGRGDFEGAVAAYRTLAQRSPTSNEAATALAVALTAAHKTAEASDIFKSLIARSPNDVQALVLLGWIEAEDGHADEARARFKLAIERQPKNTAGYVALARLETREHRGDDAIAVLQSGHRAVPDDQALQFGLASTLQTAGRYDQSIAVYEDMIRRHPDSLVPVNNLAILLADHRRDAASLEKAAALAARLTDQAVSQFIDTRGWVSYRRGQYDTATELLESAAAAAADRPAVRYHLGMAYLAQHDAARATAELKTAAGLNPDPELAAEIGKALKAAGD